MTPPAGLATLLHIRWCLLRNRLRGLTTVGWLKLAALGLLTFGFLIAIGWLAYFLIGSVYAKEDLSPVFVLAILQRLLSLVFLVVLSMLFFSNVTTAIANIYLSRDLDLLLATPVRTTRVFALKLIETVINSSYMAVLFVLPILIAYGLVFGAAPAFYLQIPFSLAAFVIPPAGAGILLTMLLMRYLPAKRTYQALSVVGLGLAVSFVTLLRVMAPEKLLAPTTTEDLRAILEALTVSGAEYLPSTWIADLQMEAVQGDWAYALGRGWPLFALAFGSLVVTFTAARAIYLRGVSAAHESAHRNRPAGVAPIPLTRSGKELRLFFRDPTQWSQLLLLGALVVVYVFNITALPSEMMIVGAFITLRDVIAWINVGLAGFVLAAIGMRFVLPSLSVEGGAFWAIAASPASRRGYVLHKLAFHLPAMLGFSLTLVALSGYALEIDPFTRNLSLSTTALMTATLTTMAVGIGAALPSFKLENPAQFVLTAGGILYGVLSLLYITAVVALEARPFFWHLLQQGGVLATGTTQPAPYYLAILALSVLLAGSCLGWGLRRIDQLEM